MSIESALLIHPPFIKVRPAAAYERMRRGTRPGE
jgi:hypothetical protein